MTVPKAAFLRFAAPWTMVWQLKGYPCQTGTSRLFESLRAFDYDLSTAIADLIDNSISAQAKNIWVDFMWAGQSSRVLVKDGGQGMSDRRAGTVAPVRHGWPGNNTLCERFAPSTKRLIGWPSSFRRTHFIDWLRFHTA